MTARATNSWAILKEFAADDPRVRVQKLNRNSGESAASWADESLARALHRGRSMRTCRTIRATCRNFSRRSSTTIACAARA